jgi:hypothetical protein
MSAPTVQPVKSQSPYSVLQAKLQAWTLVMLSAVCDAYDLGAVLGAGAAVRSAGAPAVLLTPDIVFVPSGSSKQLKPDGIYDAAALAIDVLHSGVAQSARAERQAQYAAAGVLEYWQIIADKGAAQFFQLGATGGYDLVPPDKAGIHFSAAMVELAFPVKWFREQPKLWQVLSWWGLIDGEDDDDRSATGDHDQPVGLKDEAGFDLVARFGDVEEGQHPTANEEAQVRTGDAADHSDEGEFEGEGAQHLAA